jgi:hypothetical protein
LLAGGVAWLAVGSSAQAASIVTVSMQGDDPAANCVAPARCSLRGAVAIANANPGTTIVVPPGGFPLTRGPLDVTGEGTTIVGAGSATTSVVATSASRVLTIRAGAEIYDLQISGGHPQALPFDPAIGGNVAFFGNGNTTLGLFGVTVRGGVATSGGGIYQEGGILQIVDSVITNNQAADGGGLYTYGSSRTVIDGSVFYFNGASRPGVAEPSGGAVRLGGGRLVAVNSTFYSNSATGGWGGGFFVGNDASLSLVNATVAGNSFYDLAVRDTSRISSANTILGMRGHGTPICDFRGGTMADDHSLSLDATCNLEPANGSIVGADPGFAPFGDYGGPTPSLALLPTSPAVDAANSDVAVCPDIDQRYAPRPQGSGCDIGAVESPFGPAPPTPAPPSGGGGGGGGGGSEPKAPAAPTVPAPPVPLPEQPAPVTSSSTAPATAPPTPAARLSRAGRLAVEARLPATPTGKVTLAWTVRKGGRNHRGKTRVTADDDTIRTTVSVPRRLRGGRLVRLVATYKAGGRKRTTPLAFG